MAAPFAIQRRVRNLRDEAVPIAQYMVIGYRLRMWRTERHMQAKDIAARLGISESKVSRLESGNHKFKDSNLENLFDAYGVDDQEVRQSITDLAKHASQRLWWLDWKDVAGKQLQAFVSFEDMAQRIRTYEPLNLPGLLQTEDYTRALMQVFRSSRSPTEIDRMVQFRRERQRKFETDPVKKLICVLDETTLGRPYGSHAVMRRQLDHLIEMAEHPRCFMRIAEYRKLDMPVQIGSTTIFDFEHEWLPDIVYGEDFDNAYILQDEEHVDGRKKHFDQLRTTSLNKRATLRRLRDLQRSMP